MTEETLKTRQARELGDLIREILKTYTTLPPMNSIMGGGLAFSEHDLAEKIIEGWRGGGTIDEAIRVGEHIGTEKAVKVAEGQMDTFLPGAYLDPKWVAGWHAAVRHTVHALKRGISS